MLIVCPECELQVSDKAASCPHCGYPMKENTTTRKPRSKSNKRRRLPNGFGQISEIKNSNLRNPFRAMVTVGKTEKGRPICKPLKPESYFPTYNDAYMALVEYNKNPYDLSDLITMQELYERWSDEYFKTLKDDGAQCELAWRYCSSIYNTKTVDVRARHIKHCMTDGVAMVGGKSQTASVLTQQKIKSIFNLMLDYALEYELVDKNYARTFKLSDETIKEINTVKKEHMAFTDDEMRKIWQHANDIKYVDVLLFQCYSGWRPQELGLLRLDNVDLENNLITGGIKTDAGENRIVPIHSCVRHIVEKKYREAVEQNHEFLFNYVEPNAKRKDTKLTYHRYLYVFEKIKLQLGFDDNHRPHDGRKQFVTMAKKYEVDEYAIKYMIGHAISDITEKVYTSRESQWLKEEIEKIKRDVKIEV